MTDYSEYSHIVLKKDDETASFTIRDDDFTLNYKGFLLISRENRPIAELQSVVDMYLLDGFTMTELRRKMP